MRGRGGGSLLSETLPVKQIQRNVQGSSLDSSLTLFYIQTTNIPVSIIDFFFIEVEQYALWATCETSNFFVLSFSPQSNMSFTPYCLMLPFLAGLLSLTGQSNMKKTKLYCNWACHDRSRQS